MPIPVQVTQVGLEASIQAAAAKAGRNLKIDLGANSRSIDSLSRPLGKITGQADEFTKSMEAANARVLAFGASVGVLAGVVNGFQALVTTTIEVEKTMANINSVLGDTSSELDKFKGQIFDVARSTGSSFETVSTAALELSRQGLESADVISRLNDAMILSRLSGLGAAESVDGLTAAFNSFKSQGETSATILNKVSAAAAAYAVSERDLIEGIKRSGSVAQQAGVNLNELASIITAVQERTSAGGAVIGNSFKTIFTRIGKQDTLTALQDLGIQITDTSGKVLPATKLLGNLAQEIDNLNQLQISEITQKVGGGFQIDKLLAALKDISSEGSVFSGTMKELESAGSTAYSRNIALNETLAASINTAGINLKELANTLGEIGVTGNLNSLLSFFNSFAEDVQNVLDGDGIGSQLAKGIVKGIGNVISGPGLAIFGAIIIKLSYDLLKFGAASLKSFFGIAQSSKEIATLQGTIANALLNNKKIQSDILSLEGNRVAQAKYFTTALNEQLGIMGKMRSIASDIAPTVYQNTPLYRGKKASGSADGYVPTAAEGYAPAVAQESANIKKGVGGARPSDRPVVIPNFSFGGGKTGTMVAHTGEHIVKNYGGSGGSAVFNRDMVKSMGLPDGAQKIGAAGGFVPNFANYENYQLSRLTDLVKGKRFQEKINTDSLNNEEKAIYNAFNNKSQNKSEDLAKKEERTFKFDASSYAMLVPTIKDKDDRGSVAGYFEKANSRIPFELKNLKIRGPQVPDAIDQAANPSDENLKDNIEKSIAENSARYANLLGKPAKKITANDVASSMNKNSGSKGAISAAVGSGFEAAVISAVDTTKFKEEKIKSLNSKGGDFDVRGATDDINTLFGLKGIRTMDFKSSKSQSNIASFAKKLYNQNKADEKLATNVELFKKAAATKAKPLTTSASGYIPNFALGGLEDANPEKRTLEGRVFEALLRKEKSINLQENIVGPDITSGGPPLAVREAKLSGKSAYADSNFGFGKPKKEKLVLPKNAINDFDDKLIRLRKADILRSGISTDKIFAIAANIRKRELTRKTDRKNVSMYASDGFIPNFANYFYDSDKLTPELRASILPAILATKKRKDGLLGPAGSGKSTMAGVGPFIQSMEDVARATGFTLISSSGLAKAPGGISKPFRGIIDAIKKSGGVLKYLNVDDLEIKKRREARIARGSDDTRSENQLKGTAYAALNEPEFVDILKKEMGAKLQIINGASGFVPNFASQNAMDAMERMASYQGSDPSILAQKEVAISKLQKLKSASGSKILKKQEFLNIFNSQLDGIGKGYINNNPVDKLNTQLNNGYLSGALDIDQDKLKNKISAFTAAKGFVPNFVSESRSLGRGVYGEFYKLGKTKIGDKFGTTKEEEANIPIGVKRFRTDTGAKRKNLNKNIATEYAMARLLSEYPLVKGITAPKIFGSFEESLRRKSIKKQIINDQLGENAIGEENADGFGYVIKAALKSKGLNMHDLHGTNYTINTRGEKVIEKDDSYIADAEEVVEYDWDSLGLSFIDNFSSKGGIVNIIDAGSADTEDKRLKTKLDGYLQMPQAQKSAAKGFVPNFAIDLTKPEGYVENQRKRSYKARTYRKADGKLGSLFKILPELFFKNTVLGDDSLEGTETNQIFDLITGVKHQALGLADAFTGPKVGQLVLEAEKYGIKISKDLRNKLAKFVVKAAVKTKGAKGYSGGFMPNFADPLKDAISREVGAGVNPSQVYVDQHSSLKNSGNPMGLMVANRRDEPSGGFQGIARARKEGANAQTYGAVNGFVPNYANTGAGTIAGGRASYTPVASSAPAASSASSASSGVGSDKNLLTKLFALQIGVSLITGVLDQAGTSGKKFSDAINKLMGTLLIFGGIIYSGPIKALKEFSDKTRAATRAADPKKDYAKGGFSGGVQGAKEGLKAGYKGKESDFLNNRTYTTKRGEVVKAPSLAEAQYGKSGERVARFTAPIGRVGGTIGKASASAGVAIGAVIGPALLAVGAFKAVNDAVSAFVSPSKQSASALGRLSVMASQAASSLSELELNSAQVSAKTSEGTNNISGMIANTFLTGIKGAMEGETQTLTGFKGTKGKANLQLSGFSQEDFAKLQEDFTKVYLAANKEGSLEARQYNAKSKFEKTLGINSQDSDRQLVGEGGIKMAEVEMQKLARIAASKKGILSIEQEGAAILQMTLKDGQRNVDFATQRAVQILKTKGLSAEMLTSLDQEVLKSQILNDLTEKQNDALNARVASRDRDVQFGETQLNNLNQQVQSAEGIGTNLDALTKYYEKIESASKDGAISSGKLNDLAKQSLLLQNSYSNNGVTLNNVGKAQLIIQEKRIANDFKFKEFADKQAVAREKETADLKDQLNTRENILSLVQRTSQAESFKSDFSAQKEINSNNLAIAKLGLQQPTSQAGTRALNLQKANLEAANVPLEATRTRTGVTDQFKNELVGLSRATKINAESFKKLANETKDYSDISNTLSKLEGLKTKYLEENNNSTDSNTDAIDAVILKFAELGARTDDEIKQKEKLSGVNVLLAKQNPVIQDLTGKLSDFAESLKSAIVELQFRKLSETSGTGILDLNAEQKLNSNLQIAGQDKSQISQAYSDASIAKDQQRLDLTTSGRDRAAITYDMEINQQILDIKKEAVNQDELSADQIKKIIDLEKQRLNKPPAQKIKEAFSESDQDRADRFNNTLIDGSIKFRDTMIDGITTAIEGATSLGEVLQNAALDFAREMTSNNLKNIFSAGQEGIGNLFSGAFQQKAAGGKITGGSGNKDDVPAMLMGGEFVMNKKAVSKYGVDLMEKINKGSISHFAKGGKVENTEPIDKYQILSGGIGSSPSNEYSSKESDVLKNLPNQTGQGGFKVPGLYGESSITGQKDLLSFASQSYSSGAQDKTYSGKGYAGVSLEGESKNLTQFGRRTGRMADLVTENKKAALGLFVQASDKERDDKKQYEEDLEAWKEEIKKIKKQEKAAKNAFLISTAANLVVSTYGPGVSQGLKTGGFKGAFESIGNTTKGIGSGLTGNFDKAGQYFSMANTDFSKAPKATIVGDRYGNEFQNTSIGNNMRNIGSVARPNTSNRLLSSNKNSQRNLSSLTSKVDDPPLDGDSYSNSNLSGQAFREIQKRILFVETAKEYGLTDQHIKELLFKFTQQQRDEFIANSPSFNDGVLPNLIPERNATGGRIPETSGIDTVPAMLSGGEFIMNAAATKRIGPSTLNQMNSAGGDAGSTLNSNTELLAKLDELISASKDSARNVNVSVSNGSYSEDKKADNTSSSSPSDAALSKKIKDAVVKVLMEEKRIGGVLRSR